MKPNIRRSLFLAAPLLFLLLLLAATLATAPRHPLALIRVVDASGKPIAGAVIRPEGLRTKPGPYESGWYGWRPAANGVSNSPVVTGADGFARVPYPKHVFERIETGTLCLSVDHPDFVPDRPERRVATAPPAGAPWREWAGYAWDRIQHKVMVARPDPVVLQKGAILRLAIARGAVTSGEGRLFAQVSGLLPDDTNSWVRPEPGVIVTRRLAAGAHTARAVWFDSSGTAWFSDVVPITSVTGQTNELMLDLKRGATVHGQLDGIVPRPVRNGRVVAQVWPSRSKPQESPPQWHTWTPVREDGSFALHSLPEGLLEIVAMCDGFVSTNGPGQFQFRYPQKHPVGTNDLALSIGMEPTARLEVRVLDPQGRPLPAARVMTWPNVRYGEWSATILMSDCYNTSDWLRRGPPPAVLDWGNIRVLDFEGVSDASGLAVLGNLPANANELGVEHPQFVLPATGTTGGGMQRQAKFKLIAGETNYLTIRLEPRDRSPITHY